MLCKSGECVLLNNTRWQIIKVLCNLLTFLCFRISDECGIGNCPGCCLTYKTCQYCEKECCWECSHDCMEVCQGEGCNRANCWDSDECNASNAERKGNYVRSYTLANEEYAICPRCAMYVIVDAIITHIRMLWRWIQSAVNYLKTYVPLYKKRKQQ